MVNLLQFVFLGIQLDRVVNWSWAVSELWWFKSTCAVRYPSLPSSLPSSFLPPSQVVFIPTWILLGLSTIGMGVRVCVLIILYKVEENQHELDQKKPIDILSVFCGYTIVGCLIVFMVSL